MNEQDALRRTTTAAPGAARALPFFTFREPEVFDPEMHASQERRPLPGQRLAPTATTAQLAISIGRLSGRLKTPIGANCIRSSRSREPGVMMSSAASSMQPISWRARFAPRQ